MLPQRIGFSLRPRTISSNDTPLTLITLNLTPVGHHMNDPYGHQYLRQALIMFINERNCTITSNESSQLVTEPLRLSFTALRRPSVCLASMLTFSVTAFSLMTTMKGSCLRTPPTRAFSHSSSDSRSFFLKRIRSALILSSEQSASHESLILEAIRRLSSRI